MPATPFGRIGKDEKWRPLVGESGAPAPLFYDAAQNDCDCVPSCPCGDPWTNDFGSTISLSRVELLIYPGSTQPNTINAYVELRLTFGSSQLAWQVAGDAPFPQVTLVSAGVTIDYSPAQALIDQLYTKTPIVGGSNPLAFSHPDTWFGFKLADVRINIAGTTNRWDDADTSPPTNATVKFGDKFKLSQNWYQYPHRYYGVTLSHTKHWDNTYYVSTGASFLGDYFNSECIFKGSWMKKAPRALTISVAGATNPAAMPNGSYTVLAYNWAFWGRPSGVATSTTMEWIYAAKGNNARSFMFATLSAFTVGTLAANNVQTRGAITFGFTNVPINWASYFRVPIEFIGASGSAVGYTSPFSATPLSALEFPAQVIVPNTQFDGYSVATTTVPVMSDITRVVDMVGSFPANPFDATFGTVSVTLSQ